MLKPILVKLDNDEFAFMTTSEITHGPADCVQRAMSLYGLSQAEIELRFMSVNALADRTIDTQFPLTGTGWASC